MIQQKNVYFTEDPIFHRFLYFPSDLLANHRESSRFRRTQSKSRILELARKIQFDNLNVILPILLVHVSSKEDPCDYNNIDRTASGLRIQGNASIYKIIIINRGFL